MIRCFIDSLIRPKNIANHVNMKLGKFICYLILLVLITALPNMVSTFTSNAVPEQYTNMIVTSLKNTNKNYDYFIKNGKLESKSNNKVPCIIEFVKSEEEKKLSPIDFTTYFIFNTGDVDILNGEVLKIPGLVINLKSEKVEISIFDPKLEEQVDPIVSKSYNDIEANGLDFSDLNNYSTYTLEVKMETAIKNLFKPYLFVSYLGSMPSVLLFSAFSILFEIVLLAGFVFFFLRSIQLRFGELFKIITFCMTPTAIISIYMLLPFGNLWQIGLYILGQIITIVYFYRAIRYVFINKIKKD